MRTGRGASSRERQLRRMCAAVEARRSRRAQRNRSLGRGCGGAMRKRRAGLGSAALGLAAGLLLGLLLLGREAPRPRPADGGSAAPRPPEPAAERAEDGGLLFVGVMTAAKYLGSRARAVRESWGREVPGRLGFYSSGGSRAPGLPGLVALARVDDSYPPQKKSFLMLAHMWARYGERFEWFMRADDDVYVRADRLERLLRSLDSRRAHYLGQAGRGNSREFGLLSLEYDENFCMGGPGVLLSRETLRRLVPHIKRCLANLYTRHEDVELGRCVRRYAGVACTWNYEMQSILYHNSSGELAFTGPLDTREVHRAITLHPVKSPPHMYRLHNYMRGLKIRELQQKRLELQDDIARMLLIGAEGERREPRGGPGPTHWDFISRSEYSLGETNPRRRIRGDVRAGLEEATREVMASINALSRQRGRFVEERQALYGYRALQPRRGALGVLDLLLMYKKYRGRKLSLPVRRHLYLRQRFTGLEMRLVPDTRQLDSQVVHLVLPVWGRGEALRRFLDTYERECLSRGERARLLVVHYPHEEPAEEWPQLQSRLQRLRREHGPEAAPRLVRGEGRFSRARALERGLGLLGPEDLALLIDVDMRLGREALRRARRNALPGRRIYFPVVLSQYSPEMRGGDEASAGFWRQFGFGIVALYKRDYEAVGRLDLRIEGWGHEDVDFFERAVRSGLQLFRAPDAQLEHRYHGVRCEPAGLPPPQLSMCRGTRADTYAAPERLAQLVYREPRYLDFARANVSGPRARAGAR